MPSIKLPATDKSTDNPARDFIELDAERILCNDIILPGEPNPHNVRLWIVSAAFSNWPTMLGAVWAAHEQDALDTLVNEGLGEALLIDESALASMDDDEREELAYLGNADEPCDLANVGCIDVRFNRARDKELLNMFAEARDRELSNLGEL